MKKYFFYIFSSLIALPLFAYSHDEIILVIESYHAQYPWDISYKNGLNQVLGSKYKLRYFEMDTKRLPESEYKNRADMAWAEYLKTDPVLVVIGDDNALRFLGPRLMNTNTPVVYLGINNNPRNYNMFGHKNITGVLERPLLYRSISYINEMLGVRKILILFDSGITSHVILSETFHGKKTFMLNNIRIDIKLIRTLSEWKESVLNADIESYDAIIVGLYQTIRDQTGNHAEAEKIVEWTSENTPVPPFAFWDFAVGHKRTIGGYVLIGKEQGIAAGEIALKILSGESAKSIKPHPGTEGQLLFSKSQLLKWKIRLNSEMERASKYIK